MTSRLPAEEFVNRFPLADTDDLDVLKAIVGKQFAPIEIMSIEDSKRFRFTMGGVQFGSVGVLGNEYSSKSVFVPVEMPNVILAIGHGAPSRIQIDGESITCHNEQVAVLAPNRKIVIERPAGSRLLLLKMPYEQLKQQLHQDSGEWASRELLFAKTVDLHKPHLSGVQHAIKFIMQSIMTSPQLLKVKPFLTSIEEIVLEQFLLIPNNFVETSTGKGWVVTPGIVRIAEEFMEANFHKGIQVSDVVGFCGCSRSSLFEGFRKYRDYSPHEFLSSQRLRHARARLLNPFPGDNVASIAYSCGIAHLGRFSADYRRRYGENPSFTLGAH